MPARPPSARSAPWCGSGTGRGTGTRRGRAPVRGLALLRGDEGFRLASAAAGDTAGDTVPERLGSVAMSGVLAGFTVAVTSDRRRDELAAMLERNGARVVLAPALRIVPFADDTAL